MKPLRNPLLSDSTQKTFRVESLDPAGLVYRNQENLTNLSPRELFRKESAREWLGQLRPTLHLYGFSKGQFSLIDLMEAIIEQSGPVDLTISTWTAANADLARLEKLLKSKSFRSVRFLIDFSFQRRQPGVLQAIRDIYGVESIRCVKNHAKFMLMKTDQYRIVVRTSMNLNFNPRFEDIDLKDDPKIYDFLQSIIEKIWDQFPSRKQFGQTVRQHNLDFARFA